MIYFIAVREIASADTAGARSSAVAIVRAAKPHCRRLLFFLVGLRSRRRGGRGQELEDVRAVVVCGCEPDALCRRESVDATIQTHNTHTSSSLLF